MIKTLRRKGKSLVITLPKIFVEQNKLRGGSPVRVIMSDANLIVTVPQRPRLVLAELMAEMPSTLPMVDGWDELKATGKEVGN